MSADPLWFFRARPL
uniref:Uncharacterized protein n=1 Tax=Anguilla anguilla TaxID=7936 RepID=A0A0E9S8S5_ANGAN